MTGNPLGIKAFDGELLRDRCGRCERVLVTDQHGCICGASITAVVAGGDDDRADKRDVSIGPSG